MLNPLSRAIAHGGGVASGRTVPGDAFGYYRRPTFSQGPNLLTNCFDGGVGRSGH